MAVHYLHCCTLFFPMYIHLLWLFLAYTRYIYKQISFRLKFALSSIGINLALSHSQCLYIMSFQILMVTISFMWTFQCHFLRWLLCSFLHFSLIIQDLRLSIHSFFSIFALSVELFSINYQAHFLHRLSLSPFHQ